MRIKQLLVGTALSLSLLVGCNTANVSQTYTLKPKINVTETMISKSEYNLEKIIEKEPNIEQYLPMIKDAVKKYEGIYPVDELLVISLLKAETWNFNKKDISWAGAAGLAQIIPETAELYGIKSYNPEYLHQARKDKRTALRYRNMFLKEITNINKDSIEKMLDYKEKYNYYNQKANDAFRKYKEELKVIVNSNSEEELIKIDERFDPEIAIDFCVKHIAELLDKRNGDIREAVSAYNAGLGAVSRYKGIPPYDETVKYQNKIINYYRSYKKFVTGEDQTLLLTPWIKDEDDRIEE